MTKGWKEGDAVPEGFRSDTTVGVAAHLILHAVTARTDLHGSVDVEKMFRVWVDTIDLNGPEGSANLLFAAVSLAAGAYFELSRLKETPPGLLLEADAEITGAVLKVMFG